MARILVVDDEKDFREALAEVLTAARHDVHSCDGPAAAVKRVSTEPFDVVLTDLRMPGGSGLDLLRETLVHLPECIVVVMTAFASLETALEALRAGASDYVTKPVDLHEVARRIGVLVRHQATLAENRLLRRMTEGATPSSALVGVSPEIATVRKLIERVAPTEAHVLIGGETGVGKGLVARETHRLSARSTGPFVPIDCASLPESLLDSELFGHLRGAFTGADRDRQGLLEVAAGGTVFLDEIGEMPLNLQPKLLRAIESREIRRLGASGTTRIDVRFVAATHRDLRQWVADGRFRADLYYRLAVFEILVPPLRDRPGDIPVIARHLIAHSAARLHLNPAGLSPEALDLLGMYRWPGNVRELSNVIERALILADGPAIQAGDLPGIVSRPADPAQEVDLKKARAAFEREHVRRVLDLYGQDKKRASEALGIDVSSLYRKLDGAKDPKPPSDE